MQCNMGNKHTLIVLESLGLIFEDDEEYNEFFMPIDSDEVSIDR